MKTLSVIFLLFCASLSFGQIRYKTIRADSSLQVGSTLDSTFTVTGGGHFTGGLLVGGIGSFATLTLTNPLTTAYGGTGLSSWAAGDLPYYASGTVLSKLTIGTAGKILRSSGTAPAWTTSTFADTYTQGGLLYAGTANTITGLTVGANQTVLQSNGTIPVWNVNLDLGPGTLSSGAITAGADDNVLVSNTTNATSARTLLAMKRSGTAHWDLNLQSSGTNDLTLYSYGTASNILTFARATGNATFSGSLTVAGDAAVNGANLTTDDATFNLINTTATTVNAFGAATTLSLGAGTGTTTVNNSLAADNFSGSSSGSNTGDQTSIVGITGSLTEFNTALTGADFATGGGTASGANTADITLAAVGAVPNANAASLSGQVLNLQPASVNFPGVVTTGTQTFAGNKTFSGATNTFSGNLLVEGDETSGAEASLKVTSVTADEAIAAFRSTDYGTELVFGGYVQTTDATVTNALDMNLGGEFYLDQGLACQVEVSVVGHILAGTNMASYKFIGDFYGNNVTPVTAITQVGSTTYLYTNETDAGYNAAFSVSGDNLRIQVTGKVSETIEWIVIVKLRTYWLY